MTFDPYQLVATNAQKLLARNRNNNNNKTEEGITIHLQANENALGSPLTKWYNRYPHTGHQQITKEIAAIKSASAANIFVANSNYSCIDILCKCFCNADSDNVIVCPPADGLPADIALIHGIEVIQAPLTDYFQPDLFHLESVVNNLTKIIFIASPNSLTGSAIQRHHVEMILNNFNGLVVVDETYINFSRQKSFIAELPDYPNLVVLQNFDIAWGLAGLGVSMLLAATEVIEILTTINLSPPVNAPAQELLVKALEEVGMVNDMIKELVQMRAALKRVLEKFSFVEKVYPSDANFLLVKVAHADMLYHFLLQKKILVKNLDGEPACRNCLRITIGTEEENTALVMALVSYQDS